MHAGPQSPLRQGYRPRTQARAIDLDKIDAQGLAF